MLMPGRHSNSEKYRFGFQGQEKDDEIKGIGNSINYKFRMHDPRIGRFFAVDPLADKYPFYSTYAFSGNRVIDAFELEGLEPVAAHDTEGNAQFDYDSDEYKEYEKYCDLYGIKLHSNKVDLTELARRSQSWGENKDEHYEAFLIMVDLAKDAISENNPHYNKWFNPKRLKAGWKQDIDAEKKRFALAEDKWSNARRDASYYGLDIDGDAYAGVGGGITFSFGLMVDRGYEGKPNQETTYEFRFFPSVRYGYGWGLSASLNYTWGHSTSLLRQPTFESIGGRGEFSTLGVSYLTFGKSNSLGFGGEYWRFNSVGLTKGFPLVSASEGTSIAAPSLLGVGIKF